MRAGSSFFPTSSTPCSDGGSDVSIVMCDGIVQDDEA
jgi:hypothetical protein